MTKRSDAIPELDGAAHEVGDLATNIADELATLDDAEDAEEAHSAIETLKEMADTLESEAKVLVDGIRRLR